MGCTGQSACTVAGDGPARNKNTAANFLKIGYTGVGLLLRAVLHPGCCWAKVLAAFFLIWGYFINQVVIFTLWGVIRCQKSFQK